MKIKQVKKIRLFKKAFEDAVKKAVELMIVGSVIGLSVNILFLTIVGVMGGSLYCQNYQINFFGINLRGQE